MNSHDPDLQGDASNDTRPAVGIYLRYYLPPTMTFVHRQLLGVSQRFRPIVLTSSLSNRGIFPHDDIRVKERSVFDRVSARIERSIRGEYASLSAGNRRFWRQALVADDVRLIHAHFGLYALEILPVARDLGMPLVATFHGFGASVLLRQPRYVSQLKHLFGYAQVLAASRATADRLLAVGADAKRLVVHYIGVPVDVFPYKKRVAPEAKVKRNETLDFLQVSSFVEVKGHRYTLEAFARFIKIYPDSRLTLAGDGPTRPEMELKCRQLGIADRVRFVGRVTTEQVVEQLHAADIFVHHSVTPERGDIEAAVTAIAEAMSTGLVVIGSNHGGIGEMIDHGHNGFLVEERDIDGYVDALEQAIACGGETGKRASETVERGFNLDKQNELLADIYNINLQ